MGKHDLIADTLTQDILRGQYRPGERLPSERDLAARFDANRGAVREAMKKLEHLGIASVQPGGARVVPLNEASLDIIEPLLDIGDVPSRELMDDISQVMNGLVQVAVETTVAQATDERLRELRAMVAPLYADDLDHEQLTTAWHTLLHAMMTGSNNLVCQLIARRLFFSFAPKMQPIIEHVTVDTDATREYARRLDAALADRDLVAVREVFAAYAKLNRESVTRAYASFEAAQQQGREMAQGTAG